MKKRLVSLLMALALCLSLLPVTALAATPNGQVIYVGNVNVTSGGYWTTGNDGTVTAFTGEGTPADNFIHYDATNNVLTLHNAVIKKGLDYSESIQGGTYIPGSAIGVFHQNGAAELTIRLEGTNTIAEVSNGIYVLAPSNSTGDASLTITGSGSLDTSGIQTGIRVQSNGGNATLSIENAKVTATASRYGNGVSVQSKNDSSVSLTVDGGSLTATGSGNYGAGIQLQFGSAVSGSGTPTVTVSNNAIVRANGNAGGIATNATAATPSGTGIVFDGSIGTVYGSVTLQDDLTIGAGETLTIGDGASLTVPDGKTLTNNGTVTTEEGGTLTLTNNGSLVCNHHFGGTATCTEKATCDLCGAEYGDFLPHSLTKTEAKAPTCTGAGNEAYWTCGSCGKYFSDASGNTEVAKDSWMLGPIGHDWMDAVYTWSDDGSTCTATRTCKHDSTHTETSKATVTAAQTKAPTCTQMGETTYKATFEADWAMTQTKVIADIPAAGHTLTKTEAQAPTCTEKGNTEYWTCGTCGKYFSDGEGKEEITLDSTVLSALGHDYKDGVCTRCQGKDPDYVPPTEPDAPAQTGEAPLLPALAVLMILSAAALLWTGRKRQQF